jgi:hypothetical protein
MESPVGTTHRSPAWKRWENSRRLKKPRIGATQSPGCEYQPHRRHARRINTYENRARKSRKICTYDFVQLNLVWNQHLKKKHEEGHRVPGLFPPVPFRFPAGGSGSPPECARKSSRMRTYRKRGRGLGINAVNTFPPAEKPLPPGTNLQTADVLPYAASEDGGDHE